MKNTNITDKRGTILKADLILSDYTLASDPEEKKIYLNLLDRYVAALEDPIVSLYFVSMSSSENNDEKELYVEILMDILSDLKNSIPAVAV